MTVVLDTHRPYRNLDQGQPGSETKPAVYVEQDGFVFAWSESNVQYECIGGLGWFLTEVVFSE